MNKILLIIFIISSSINLTAAQEEDNFFSKVQTEADYDHEHQTDNCKPLAELPKFEQLVHRSLMSKFNVLHVHQEFILRQNETLLRFMRVLENEKDEEGKIDEERLAEIVKESHFPKVLEMRPFLEKIKDDLFIGYKIDSLLALIFKDDTKAVYNWFALLENEISTDIDNYEKADIPLPQYRYMLTMYSDLKNFQINTTQLLPLMSPKVFKN